MNDKIYELYELKDEYIREYFNTLKSGEKYTYKPKRINPSMYKKALTDFMLFGKVTRYPTKYILRWKEYILDNIMYLDAMTDVGGHSSNFPYEIFNDEFRYNHDTGETDETFDYTIAVDELEAHGDVEKFPTWSNGQWLLSDYAIDPLMNLLEELIETEDPTEILILINKVLDVTHQRSDVAELFIVGGSESLELINN